MLWAMGINAAATIAILGVLLRGQAADPVSEKAVTVWSNIEIRDAVVADAPAACEVLRRSITELYGADHQNDAGVILEQWLANKTPEIVASWVMQPGNSVLLAVEGDAVLGVGSITDAGEITLNYVSPDTRFQGVSRCAAARVEACAAERGNTQCKLTSTQTARRFYFSAGYSDDSGPVMMFGTSSYPMSKWLRSPPMSSR